MNKKKFKSGFAVILGRPNVGKSTLLNSLIGNKVSIVSPIPQTTRYQIKGVLNVEGAQIVFLDTPGIHSFKDELAKHLNVIAKKSMEGCDLILYVVDVSRDTGREEQNIVKFVGSQNINIIVVFNKMDLEKKHLDDYVEFCKRNLSEQGRKVLYVPVSALTGKNIDVLKNLIVENLPEGEPFYDTETVTDFPLKFRVADIIREKLCLNLREEVPHSVAVEVEDMNERQTTKGEDIIDVKANIYVVRLSQKKIIIGRSGELLKTIGSTARPEIEKILGKRIFLDIWVKVKQDWQQKPGILQELGYWWT